MSIAMKSTSYHELVNSSFETITPADAKRMLAQTNFRNRPISQKHVNYLADLITAGFWKTNGDTIKLDKSGNVIDGQHRLHAIVKSQKTVVTCVVRNLDQSVFALIDNNRRARTDGNVLSVYGYKYANTLAAAVKVVYAFDQAGFMAFSAGSSCSSKHLVKAALISQLIDKYSDITLSAECVCRLNGSRVFRPSSLTASLHYIFGRHDSMRRDWFFDSLHRNHFTSATCPARALFMAYQSEKLLLKMQSSQRYRAALWFKAFSQYCKGASIKHLQFQDNEKFPTLS